MKVNCQAGYQGGCKVIESDFGPRKSSVYELLSGQDATNRANFGCFWALNLDNNR